MDTIRIHELKVWTHIGVPDAEREKEQRLLLNVELHLSLQATAAADDPSAGIDYSIVADRITALALQARNTIERFAEDCAQMILAEFRCERVTVTVRKFPLPQAASVEVVITRP